MSWPPVHSVYPIPNLPGNDFRFSKDIRLKYLNTTLSTPLIPEPVTLIPVLVFPNVDSLPMSHIVFPHSFVVVSICRPAYSEALNLIMLPLPLEVVTITPYEHPLPFDFIIDPLAIEPIIYFITCRRWSSGKWRCRWACLSPTVPGRYPRLLSLTCRVRLWVRWGTSLRICPRSPRSRCRDLIISGLPLIWSCSKRPSYLSPLVFRSTPLPDLWFLNHWPSYVLPFA